MDVGVRAPGSTASIAPNHSVSLVSPLPSRAPGFLGLNGGPGTQCSLTTPSFMR